MLNHIVLMGRLVADPELRYTQSQVAVTSFRIAVDRDFAPKDGGDRQADFISCVAWRSTGEFVSKYFRKGSMIVVSGRLQMRDWQDRDGNKRTTAEVQADNVYFGDSKRRDDGDSYGGYSRSGGYEDRPARSDNYSRGQQPRGGSDRRSAPPAEAPAYNGGAFAELGDSDGELPF